MLFQVSVPAFTRVRLFVNVSVLLPVIEKAEVTVVVPKPPIVPPVQLREGVVIESEPVRVPLVNAMVGIEIAVTLPLLKRPRAAAVPSGSEQRRFAGHPVARSLPSMSLELRPACEKCGQALAPGGASVAFLADLPVDGQFDLWVAPVAGPAARLRLEEHNMTLRHAWRCAFGIQAKLPNVIGRKS